MRKIGKIFILFILISCLPSRNGLSQSSVKIWDIYEINLISTVAPENPYVSLLEDGKPPFVTATFTCISGTGTGRTITVPGFWDGNGVWKIRFAAPISGTWKFKTISSDRKMNGKKGQLTVSDWTAEEKDANPTRRGFIVVNKSSERNGRYFTYSDGSPVLWIADT
jgi:hypothetical protein